MRKWPILILHLVFAPAVGCGLISLIIQLGVEFNPVYAVSFQTDLGRLLLFTGLLFSLGAAAGWAAYLWAYRQRVARLAISRDQLLEERRRFMRHLDHEMKNPLTALRLELAYLAGDVPAEECHQTIADMSTQVDRLSRLVSDLRKLLQLEEKELQIVTVNLDEVLGEVIEAIEDHPNFDQRKVKLTIHSPLSPLPPVKGDRGLLWLACFNLLDNALKFTPPGTEIEIRVRQDGGWMVLEIADNGPGIAKQDLPHLFEELYRGENARGLPGSGLGLALVRTIVKMHRGSISVRSQEDRGTVFTVRLPVHK